MRKQSVAYIFATEGLLMFNKIGFKMKVEVFRTNVADPEQAKWLMDQIERNFTNCQANFDLDDCDRILRVVFEGEIQSDPIAIGLLIDLLQHAGCFAEVLPDSIQTI